MSINNILGHRSQSILMKTRSSSSYFSYNFWLMDYFKILLSRMLIHREELSGPDAWNLKFLWFSFAPFSCRVERVAQKCWISTAWRLWFWQHKWKKCKVGLNDFSISSMTIEWSRSLEKLPIMRFIGGRKSFFGWNIKFYCCERWFEMNYVKVCH